MKTALALAATAAILASIAPRPAHAQGVVLAADLLPGETYAPPPPYAPPSYARPAPHAYQPPGYYAPRYGERDYEERTYEEPHYVGPPVAEHRYGYGYGPDPRDGDWRVEVPRPPAGIAAGPPVYAPGPHLAEPLPPHAGRVYGTAPCYWTHGNPYWDGYRWVPRRVRACD